jgi:hypothetical protein
MGNTGNTGNTENKESRDDAGNGNDTEDRDNEEFDNAMQPSTLGWIDHKTVIGVDYHLVELTEKRWRYYYHFRANQDKPVVVEDWDTGVYIGAGQSRGDLPDDMHDTGKGLNDDQLDPENFFVFIRRTREPLGQQSNRVRREIRAWRNMQELERTYQV